MKGRLQTSVQLSRMVEVVMVVAIVTFFAGEALKFAGFFHEVENEPASNSVVEFNSDGRFEYKWFGPAETKGKLHKTEKLFSYPSWLVVVREVAISLVAAVVWPMGAVRQWTGVYWFFPEWDGNLLGWWLAVGLLAILCGLKDIQSRIVSLGGRVGWLIGLGVIPLVSWPLYRMFRPEGDLWPCPSCGRKKLITIHTCQFCRTQEVDSN